MNHGLFGLLLALAVALSGSGCDLARSDEPADRGLLTRAPESEGAEMSALLRGTLALDPERGCVLLSGRPVVWPAGTTLTHTAPELHLPGGLRARSGDEISGGGGAVPASTLRETALRIEGDLEKALACAPRVAEVLVFSARGDDIGVASRGDPRPCRVSQLRMRLFLQGAGGSLFGAIRARNTSAFPCLLRGRPRITLRYSDGRSIRATEGNAPPFWRLEGRPRPRGWPLVRVPHEGLAQSTIALQNWCDAPDQRVRLGIELPSTGGVLALEARVRLRCDLPAEPVTLRVGPFEPAPG